MIRPITCLAMLAAAGSGLYLYQAKHQAFVLDSQIAKVSGETAKLREHIAVLRAEYALLNDPSRLQDLASAHLPGLAPLAPGQFTTLAQLDQRLPPVGAPAPSAAPNSSVPAGVKVGSEPYDYPPAPVPVAEAPFAAAPVVAEAARPATADIAMSRPHVASALAPVPATRPVALAARKPPHPKSEYVARAAPRRVPVMVAAAPRPDPLAIQTASPPISGNPARVASALGMARTMVAPSPAAYTFQRYNPGAAETLGR